MAPEDLPNRLDDLETELADLRRELTTFKAQQSTLLADALGGVIPLLQSLEARVEDLEDIMNVVDEPNGHGEPEEIEVLIPADSPVEDVLPVLLDRLQDLHGRVHSLESTARAEGDQD